MFAAIGLWRPQLGKVIKAQGTGAAGQPVISRNSRDALTRAKSSFRRSKTTCTPTQRAATQAEIIVRTARMEAEEILAEARRVGREMATGMAGPKPWRQSSPSLDGLRMTSPPSRPKPLSSWSPLSPNC